MPIIAGPFEFAWGIAGANSPCEHTVSASRGRPEAKLLLPFDPRCPRPEIIMSPADVKVEVAAREVQGGHEFELNAYSRVRWERVADVGLPCRCPGIKESLTLDRVPATDRIRMGLRLPPGAVLIHQPELTPREIDEGCHRPEQIVDSYVIRLANGVKAGHIPRLSIADDDGRGERLWLGSTWDGSILTILLPMAWLGSAGRQWPVVVDPSVGDSDIGGTAVTDYDDTVYVYSAVATGSGNITHIKQYISGSSEPYKHAIYDDVAGDATNLLRQTVEGTADGAPGWVELALTSAYGVTDGVAYHLGSNHDTNNTTKYYDAGSYKQAYKGFETYTGSGYNFLDPFSTISAESTNRDYSIYGYASGGEPPAFAGRTDRRTLCGLGV